MEAARFVDAIRNELARLAALGDDRLAALTERLAVALEGPLVLQLAEAAATWAAEASAQLPDGGLVARFADGRVDVLYLPYDEDPAHDEKPPPADPAPPAEGEDLSARITLRLPAGLKERVDRAAATEGVSTNAWVLRALAEALAPDSPRGPRAWSRLPRPPGGRRRLTGYGRS